MRKVIREAIEELVCTRKIVSFEDTYDSNKNDAKDSTITENDGTPELSITTNTEEMRCIHEKTKQSQKAQNNRKIARPPKSNIDSESSNTFGLKRKAVGRQVMSSNSGCSEKQDTRAKSYELKSKVKSNFPLTPNNSKTVRQESINIVEASSISLTPLKQSGTDVNIDTKNRGYYGNKRNYAQSFAMVDDFWSDGNVWTCYSCEASFKLEFAFRNHLRKHDSCNQRYVCLTCDDTLKLLDVKLHISKMYLW